MSPTHKINKDKILKVWTDVIKHVTMIGFDVVVTMTDGHSSNVSFFEFLVQNLDISGTDVMMIRNPFDVQNYIRLLFDTVHIFKNFYTNFLN